jgi:hypothetical protein
MADRHCKGTNKQGKPCKAPPLNDSGRCISHSPTEIQASLGFGGIENSRLGGKGRHQPIPVAQKLVEDNVAVLLEPYFRTLGYEVVVDDDDARLERIEDGGAKLYGTQQRSGEIVVSKHDDIGAMQNAAEKLFDRVYGKPRQQTEISGPGGTPIQVASTFDLEKLTVAEKRDLLELLQKAGDGSPVGR